jgi:hypothetical protein
MREARKLSSGVVFWVQPMRERVENACLDDVTATNKCVISDVLFAVSDCFNRPHLTAGENE